MGAMALFGEKYGDKVRVVKFGDSIELCGGTHVANTGNIGMIRIISESSIAAGIRRIEAVTGEGVENVLDNFQDIMRSIQGMLGNNADVKQAVQKAISENTELHKKVEEYMDEKITSLSRNLIAKAEDRDGIKLVVYDGILAPENVKLLALAIRREAKDSTMFVAATKFADKPLLTVSMTDDLVSETRNASKAVREAARHIKGGGGGQPFFAQAGGKDTEGLEPALQQLIATLV